MSQGWIDEWMNQTIKLMITFRLISWSEPQGLHRHREDEEIENDQKTLRISSIWEKEDDSHNTPSHNTGHDPDDDNDEDANGQHDPNVRVKTITSSTSPPTSSSSSSTTAKPVVVPILSLSTTASPTTHSPTLPPLTVRSSATRPSATHIQKLSKKENDRNDNRETMKNSTADISVLNGLYFCGSTPFHLILLLNFTLNLNDLMMNIMTTKTFLIHTNI